MSIKMGKRMEEVAIYYDGNLSTRAVRRAGSIEIVTDAPKENGGRDEYFSPTDLVAIALGSCILTVMAIAAVRMQVNFVDSKVLVQKQMASLPSWRIKRLKVHFSCPRKFDPEIIKHLEKAANNCPVHHSLHPEIEQEITFLWGTA